MENKELIIRAKEIILKGAKQVNIELPEFEIDIDSVDYIDYIEAAINRKSPSECLLFAFNWSSHDKKHNYWDDIYRRLPSAITIKYKYLNV